MSSPSSLFDIRGRVVVISGATGVLAGSAAHYLAAQGAKVVFLGRDQSKLDLALAQVRSAGGEAAVYACDVLDRAKLEETAADISRQYGRIDALVNAAGGNQPGATIPPTKTFLDLDFKAYREVLALNLEGTVLPSLVFGKYMMEKREGTIINFSSMAATTAITRVVGYSNAKAAVDNFTRWLAVEMATKYGGGIRVNAVAPGFFVADQNRRLLLNEDGTPTERGQKVLNQTPFNRFGVAEDLHGTLHFLISRASAFITGTIIPVDGGFLAYSGV